MDNENQKKKSPSRFSKLLLLLEDVKIVLEIIYVIVFLFFFLFLLLELKRYYSIDVFPGYDTAIDDLYGAMKGIISELFKKLFGEEVKI
ncbi:hypothetical protein [Schleiferia thermophila]|jgi:hypothetical protein|uniref:Uncharacterized protein n=1 Tax=Schleiferia thermophila TaxID=884107 RepID=A0A369A1X3_9FLAO|nr:hypothetical protein [Schleiferia thermophila]KFD38709.1 hypothetical protein AT05_08695 [Schleiferia thermophila str. Yellowstone]PMB20204.1 hypothetical protein CEN47_22235 [Fischerella thermalis CCMEE 5319]RCX02077.1 hypothetical protein DES35_10548 [Schleiferia thermophila]GCD80599.1 hypothetical protein JCM30197_18460 [Schleiferia thermophila]